MEEQASRMPMLKEVASASSLAWCPLQHEKYLLAAGTTSGTIDDSFQTSSRLALYSTDLSIPGTEMKLRGQYMVKDMDFVRVAWGAKGFQDGILPLGLIAGGMTNGSLLFWNAQNLLDGSATPPISAKQHNGNVSGLAFHPSQVNLIASGSSDGELLIWDLQNLQAPTATSPGSTGHRYQSISDLAWNFKVPHIMASTTQRGETNVWDLRQQRAVITFNESSHQHVPATSITWNPSQARQLVVAYSHPIAEIWDLRVSMSPMVKLSGGHSHGILSVAWCPHDHDVLVTTGEDSLTCLWSSEGDLLDTIQDNDITFCSRWNPHVPGLIAGSTYQGKITMRGVSKTGNHVLKWRGRPLGAVFGFGAKLVSFGYGTSSTAIRIHRVISEPSLIEVASEFQNAIATTDMPSFCEQKMSVSANDEEEYSTWQFLRLLFDRDPQPKMFELLGFQPSVPIASPTNAEEIVRTSPSQLDSRSPLKQDDISDEDFFNQLSREESKASDSELDDSKPSSPRESEASAPLVSSSEDSPEDRGINNAVVSGDFATAVSLCMKASRPADALLLAYLGGNELWADTQAKYLQNHSKRFMRGVCSAISTKDIPGYVAKSDISRWKETLAVISTYVTGAESYNVISSLASHLLDAGQYHPAVLCYLVAANVDGAASVWRKYISLRDVKTASLQSAIEKLFVLCQASASHGHSPGPLSALLYSEYAGLLAAQGETSMAFDFINVTNSQRADYGNSMSAADMLAHRIYYSGSAMQQYAPPPQPFDILPVRGANEPAPSSGMSGRRSSMPGVPSGRPGPPRAYTPGATRPGAQGSPGSLRSAPGRPPHSPGRNYPGPPHRPGSTGSSGSVGPSGPVPGRSGIPPSSPHRPSPSRFAQRPTGPIRAHPSAGRGVRPMPPRPGRPSAMQPQQQHSASPGPYGGAHPPSRVEDPRQGRSVPPPGRQMPGPPARPQRMPLNRPMPGQARPVPPPQSRPGFPGRFSGSSLPTQAFPMSAGRPLGPRPAMRSPGGAASHRPTPPPSGRMPHQPYQPSRPTPASGSRPIPPHPIRHSGPPPAAGRLTHPPHTGPAPIPPSRPGFAPTTSARLPPSSRPQPDRPGLVHRHPPAPGHSMPPTLGSSIASSSSASSISQFSAPPHNSRLPAPRGRPMPVPRQSLHGPAPGLARGPPASAPGPARGPPASAPGPARGPPASAPGPARGPPASAPGLTRGPPTPGLVRGPPGPGLARGFSGSGPLRGPSAPVSNVSAPAPGSFHGSSQAPFRGSPAPVPNRVPAPVPARGPALAPTRVSPAQAHSSQAPTRSLPFQSLARNPPQPPTRGPPQPPVRGSSQAPSRSPSQPPARSPPQQPTRGPPQQPTRGPPQQPTRAIPQHPARSHTSALARAPSSSRPRNPTSGPIHVNGPSKAQQSPPAGSPEQAISHHSAEHSTQSFTNAPPTSRQQPENLSENGSFSQKSASNFADSSGSIFSTISELVNGIAANCPTDAEREEVAKIQQDLLPLNTALSTGSLTATTMAKLSTLANALQNSDYKTASQVHVQLITESWAEAKGWLPVIKNVINICKKYC